MTKVSEIRAGVSVSNVLIETGVYAVVNLVNGKRYIGSTVNSFRGRWAAHKRRLAVRKHCNDHLQNAWNKYGEDCFRFDVLERCLPANCLAREQYYLNEWKTWNSDIGYNICRTAGSTLGVKHTEASKKKMKGKTRSKEARRNISAAKLGKAFSEEVRNARRGKPRSEETRRKISVSLIGNTRSVGRTHSEATKEKIRKSSTGRLHSEETKRKVSDLLKGRCLSEETKKKISTTLKRRYLEVNGSSG